MNWFRNPGIYLLSVSQFCSINKIPNRKWFLCKFTIQCEILHVKLISNTGSYNIYIKNKIRDKKYDLFLLIENLIRYKEPRKNRINTYFN